MNADRRKCLDDVSQNAVFRARFMNYQWHSPAAIAEAVGQPEAQVVKWLDLAVRRSKANRGKPGYQVEKARVALKVSASLYAYRMVYVDKWVDVDQVVKKLTPIIKLLRTEGLKNKAYSSIRASALAAEELEKALRELTE